MTTAFSAPETLECLLSKANSCSDLTEMTDLPSDSDSVCEETTSTSLDDSNREQEGSGNKLVRFSIVYIREFEAIEKEHDLPSITGLDSTYDSTYSTYTDTESDVETHQSEKVQRRKDRYIKLIQYQIHRAEIKKEDEQKKIQEGKKGFRSKILKPLWKGFVEAASRTPLVVPMPGY